MLSPAVFAQEYTCGDATGDGQVNIADVVFYFNYLRNLEDAPPILDAADVDSIAGITYNDAAYLAYNRYGGGPLPYCPPFPDSTLEVTGDILEIRNTLIPPGATIARIDLHIESFADYPIHCISFPFEYSCATSNINLYDITIPENGLLEENAHSKEIYSQENKGLIGFARLFPSETAPVDGLIATLWFTIDALAEEQTIVITPSTLPPSNVVIFSKLTAEPKLEAFYPTIVEVPVFIVDTDMDGVGDEVDNCPLISNPNQEDADGDSIGDVCDNCPEDSNTNQADSDGDGFGDVCDNCPVNNNPNQEDADGDDVGDLCDICPDDYDPAQADTDDDGHGDGCDNCPMIANFSQTDSDGDGIGDACEGDPICGDLNNDNEF
ncbi:MAG: hypothetical protein GY865_06735, partial [candidate division Zixibacteria bacterium]|nr:hypothetical protein [candidate division Zixibacteria bacterium]